MPGIAGSKSASVARGKSKSNSSGQAGGSALAGPATTGARGSAPPIIVIGVAAVVIVAAAGLAFAFTRSSGEKALEADDILSDMEKGKEKRSAVLLLSMFAEDECYVGDGRDYQGTIHKTTKDGHKCQHWKSDTPHPRNMLTTDIKNFPDKSFEAANNFCRNPDNSERPWCYTTEPKVPWGYCGVPRCKECFNGDGRHYKGAISVSEKGNLCQPWASQSPHPHTFGENYFGTWQKVKDAKNYCRNPTWKTGMIKFLWCIPVDGDNIRMWARCDIPICSVPLPKKSKPAKGKVNPVNCFRNVGEDYIGNLSRTHNLITCQRWKAQKPNVHSSTSFPADKNNIHAAKNYCRNPLWNKGINYLWCVSNLPGYPMVRCDVPKCNRDGFAIKRRGIDCWIGNGKWYNGTLSRTQSGHQCLRWDSRKRHDIDEFRHLGLTILYHLHNFCRNPSWKSGIKYIWCYSSKKGRLIEACHVDKCYPEPDPFLTAYTKYTRFKCIQHAPDTCASYNALLNGRVAKKLESPSASKTQKFKGQCEETCNIYTCGNFEYSVRWDKTIGRFKYECKIYEKDCAMVPIGKIPEYKTRELCKRN